MDEQRAIHQQHYLNAMGVTRLVSRHALPGAAPSRRLPLPVVSPAETRPTELPAAPAPTAPPAPPASPASREQAPADPSPAETAGASVRFSMAAVVAGGYLWLEEVPRGVIPSDAVALIRAMAAAVQGDDAAPEVAQFDWPLHNNRQLDQGEDAARAALGSFLQRRIEGHACQAVMLLGEDAARRLEAISLPDIPRQPLPATAEMLENPALKARAWSVLKPLCRRLA